MENNNVIIHHYLKELYKSIDRMFTSNSTAEVARIFNDLCFYIANPECAEELEKDDLAQPLSDSLSIISTYTDVYERFCNIDKPTKERWEKAGYNETY